MSRCCSENRTKGRAGRTAESHKRRTVEVEGGVAISPLPLTHGERVTVKYDGLLAKSGAEQIYLRRGYGSAQSWNSVQDLPMQRNDGVWEVGFEADDESRLNFCFRDHVENWDNNNGRNWSLEIHTGEIP
ncbi:MAG: carbohydrate-binding protein [Syntrophaceticus sp.]|jgi:hypothetical protein